MQALQLARRRLRGRTWPILQTAAAAVVAWYLAIALLPAPRPLFAPIAAVIALGATVGHQGRRTFELVGGVVLGIAVADLLVAAIGTGPWQGGVIIVLAMGTAVVLGGRELLVAEAAVSAILIATLPGGGGLPPDRFFEAIIGGGVALAVGVLLFPPDPALLVARALNGLFADLGRTLGDVARALETGDPALAERAQESAGTLDDDLVRVRQELLAVRETARFAPPRRGARGQLGRFERTLPHLDFAARDARVLTRNALRFLRSGAAAPPAVREAVAMLPDAVWALAASFDDDRRAAEARRLAIAAAGRVTELADGARDLRLAELVVQVRSVAVDLVRAAEQTGGDVPPPERPTDELLPV